MAVLNTNDLAVVYGGFVEDLNSTREPIAVVKADLRAALAAVDAWVDANVTSYNQAIPQPARGALTAKQKARLLRYVVQRRFEVS